MTADIRVTDYAAFLDHKAQAGRTDGFDPGDGLPAFLFDFQAFLVRLALMHARFAVLTDCGTGKTPMLLAWSDAVMRHTNGSVLILTPLAVAGQIVREGEKFGIPVHHSRDGSKPAGACLVVTNYEQLHRFDSADYVAVACDESSMLKNFEGTRRAEVTAFMRKMRFRSLWTATAAPNDYVELGTSSEALGELGHIDMLTRFFKNEQNNIATGRQYAAHGGGSVKWRFKGHAEEPYWRWVASWARAMRRPSDLGFDDGRFLLPPLIEREHHVESETLAEGMLFALPAVGLKEQRDERRRTLPERCEKAAALVADTGKPAVVWCHLNDESDRLTALIPGAVEVSGAMSDDEKEERLLGFSTGAFRVLVTKPTLAGYGLNWQHCAHETMFPSHSFEQYYQSVRRCWRFGQTQPVTVDIVTTTGERGILANLQRKSVQADRMFDALVRHMHDATTITRAVAPHTSPTLPSWL